MKSAMQWLKESGELGEILLFLDFDGTLAPIVERPGDAKALAGTPEIVSELGKKVAVAVISGRGLDDIRRRFWVDDIYYAGSHGLEIVSPDGSLHEPEAVEKYLPAIDKIERSVEEHFSGRSGIELERKRFGLAVHFRREPEAEREVEEVLGRAVAENPGLQIGLGKMVREVQPDLEWDKGHALRFIRKQLAEEGRRGRPIYLGDDWTDEHAFEVIADDGIGILVTEEPRPTAAKYILSNPQEVQEFLRALSERI